MAGVAVGIRSQRRQSQQVQRVITVTGAIARARTGQAARVAVSIKVIAI